jgi:hypothetical protein
MVFFSIQRERVLWQTGKLFWCGGDCVGGQHLERVFDLFQKIALVLLDRQNIVGLFVDDLLGYGSFAHMALTVTAVPLSSSASSNCGIAAISLDFSSTLRWPSTGPLVLAQAETICTMAFLSGPFLLGFEVTCPRKTQPVETGVLS